MKEPSGSSRELGEGYKYVSLGLTFAGGIILFMGVGFLLDRWLGWMPILTVAGTLFGAIIAIVCCYKGMTATGGAAGVGRAVNEAVVTALLGVFAFNYVFTQTLLATHPALQVIR